MEESKKPSKSRIGRTFRLARLATETSSRFALGMAKRAIKGEVEGDKPIDIEQHKKIALRALDILGNMKGLPMKAGQILSYVDDWMPDDVRPAYQEVLSRLQAKAPTVPLADMLNVFIDEVGEPPDEVFQSFDDQPIAAASIGQVYRAVLPSGEPVAVKIQYPNIDKVIRSDLKNLDLLESVMRASTFGRLDVTQSLRDIKTKIGEELDYVSEAAHQRRFGEIYADHPRIVIPKIHDEYSHKRVLTSELIEGKTYYEFRDTASPDETNSAAKVLYEFVFRTLHCHSLFNADPHPGNYIFMDDGRIAFLDFGCVQQFEHEVLERYRRLIVKMWEGDMEAIREGLPEALGYPGDASEQEKDFFFDYVTHLWRPVLEDAPFCYDEAYSKEVFKRTATGVKVGAKVTLRKGSPDTEIRGLALLNRLQFGFVSILGGLKAEANWYRLFRSFFSAEAWAELGVTIPADEAGAPSG